MQKPLGLLDHARTEVAGFGQLLVHGIKEKEDIQLSSPFEELLAAVKFLTEIEKELQS